MTKNDIARELLKVLPDELLSHKKSAQLSFDFVPPANSGVKKAEEYVSVIMETIKRVLLQGENVEISSFGQRCPVRFLHILDTSKKV